MSLPINTQRLLLRNLTHKDIQDILELLAHPSVARIMNMDADRSTIRNYIDKQNQLKPFQEEKYYDLAVEYKETGKLIGLIGLLCKPHKQGAIGWVLGNQYRGRGYATEGARALMNYAFSELGLHRVYAETSNINIPSWKLMERLGMRREAQFREAEYREDCWIDVLIYAILVDEWLLIADA